MPDLVRGWEAALLVTPSPTISFPLLKRPLPPSINCQSRVKVYLTALGLILQQRTVIVVNGRLIWFQYRGLTRIIKRIRLTDNYFFFFYFGNRNDSSVFLVCFSISV